MARWVAFSLMTASLAAAVVLKGGVYPTQWEWSALGISIAACLLVFRNPRLLKASKQSWGFVLMGLLLGWMVLQLVPLPPAVVGSISPSRWAAALAARMAAAGSAGSWLALSVAPSATTQRLLDVAPAMACFVATYELGRRLNCRAWWLAAPLVVIASLESLLGILQYYLLRMERNGTPMATGTYVNRNHFAGLLEMALPLTIAWAIASWRRGHSSSQGSGGRDATDSLASSSRGISAYGNARLALAHGNSLHASGPRSDGVGMAFYSAGRCGEPTTPLALGGACSSSLGNLDVLGIPLSW